jgi:hypothetical protein
VVPSIHDVVDRSRILDTQFAGHKGCLAGIGGFDNGTIHVFRIGNGEKQERYLKASGRGRVSGKRYSGHQKDDETRLQRSKLFLLPQTQGACPGLV